MDATSTTTMAAAKPLDANGFRMTVVDQIREYRTLIIREMRGTLVDPETKLDKIEGVQDTILTAFDRFNDNKPSAGGIASGVTHSYPGARPSQFGAQTPSDFINYMHESSKGPSSSLKGKKTLIVSGKKAADDDAESKKKSKKKKSAKKEEQDSASSSSSELSSQDNKRYDEDDDEKVFFDDGYFATPGTKRVNKSDFPDSGKTVQEKIETAKRLAAEKSKKFRESLRQTVYGSSEAVKSEPHSNKVVKSQSPAVKMVDLVDDEAQSSDSDSMVLEERYGGWSSSRKAKEIENQKRASDNVEHKVEDSSSSNGSESDREDESSSRDGSPKVEVQDHGKESDEDGNRSEKIATASALAHRDRIAHNDHKRKRNPKDSDMETDRKKKGGYVFDGPPLNAAQQRYLDLFRANKLKGDEKTPKAPQFTDIQAHWVQSYRSLKSHDEFRYSELVAEFRLEFPNSYPFVEENFLYKMKNMAKAAAKASRKE